MNPPQENPPARSYEQLAASEARYRTLVENPNFGVFLLDLEGNYVYVNSSIQELTGYTPEEFYHSRRMGFRITHPDDHAIGVRAFRRALLGRSSHHQEFRLRHRDGSSRWTSAASFPVFDDSGAVHCIQVVIQDITDRKKAEEALAREYETRDAEATVRVRIAQMEKPPDLLDVVGEIGGQLARLGVAHDSCSIQVINTEGTDFVSFGSQHKDRVDSQLAGFRGLSWTPTSDNISRYPWVREVWKTGESRYVPATDETSNLPLEMSLVDVAFSHGTLAVNRRTTRAYGQQDIRLLERFAGVLSDGFQRFVDITETDRLEQQLRESQKMEAIGQLVAGVSHNFNNMLMVILGNLELARPKVTGEPLRNLEDALNASQRASDVIEDLLLFSRPDRADKEITDVGSLVGKAVTMCQRTFGERVELRLAVPEALPGVRGHPTQLQQVAMDLCLNARDAVASAGFAEPRIEVDLDAVKIDPALVPGNVSGPVGRCLRLRVRDRGVGMDAPTQARIFEPFYTTKEVGKGTGLGLSTAYAIVRDHGGWIEVESQTGRGALFTVYLPAADGDVVAREEPSVPRVRSEGEEILIVEDEEGIRRIVRIMLQRAGYRVHESGDGQSALEQVRQHGEDLALVLLDLSMPGMPGQEVLRRLAEAAPELDVVLLTGQDVEVADYPGVAAVVNKPVSRNELLGVVGKVIDGAR